MKIEEMSDEQTFLNWMRRNFGGFYYAEWPCWNWRIGGVLVTLWLRTGIVKIYHDEGRATEWHPAETERCREAVMSLTPTRQNV